MLLERDVYRCDSTGSNGTRRRFFLCYSQGRGETFLFSDVLAGPDGGLPYLACPAVARICAAPFELRPWLLCAESSRSMPVQRRRARTGTESCLADGIRAAELRDFFHPRFWLGPRAQHHRARGQELAC